MDSGGEWPLCRVDMRDVRRRYVACVHAALFGACLNYAATAGSLAGFWFSSLLIATGVLLLLLAGAAAALTHLAGETALERLYAAAAAGGAKSLERVRLLYCRDGWEYGRDEGYLGLDGEMLVFSGLRTRFCVPKSSVLRIQRADRLAAGAGLNLGIRGSDVEIVLRVPDTATASRITLRLNDSPASLRPAPLLMPPRTPQPRSWKYLVDRAGEDKSWLGPSVFGIFVALGTSFMGLAWPSFVGLGVYVAFIAGGLLRVVREDRERLRRFDSD